MRALKAIASDFMAWTVKGEVEPALEAPEVESCVIDVH